ncbi:MAG: hypothetical protein J0H34_04570 [Rhizobiales bacterium]|nr:hypothetical protein [Hyphomicrobiales bacterium]
MSYFERTREAAAQDLEEQITMLSKQLAALQKAARKRGLAALEEGGSAASDAYADAWDRFQDALPALRSRAARAEAAARENPAITAALLGTALAGLAILFFSRR